MITAKLSLYSLPVSIPAATPYDIKSPDKRITVRFAMTTEGSAVYSIFFNAKMVLAPSRLGIIREDGDFSKGLALCSVSRAGRIGETYTLRYGKRKKCLYRATQRSFHLRNETGAKLDIVFRVSNDGVGFRYLFPEKSSDVKKIATEATSFHFLPGTRAWLHHCPDSKEGWCRTQPSYEENYRMGMAVGTEAPFQAGWVMPGLFAYEGHWLTVSEAALDRHYCGSRLSRESPDGEYRINFPQAGEGCPGGPVLPESTLPWHSPWRIIGVADRLCTVAESTLGTDLADPAAYNASAYARPGRASWSWVILKDEATTFPTQKEFIDFAADMHWEHCLIDAYWDEKIPRDRVKELVQYARGKHVAIHLWYNSAGSWNTTTLTPKDALLTKASRAREFQFLKDIGVAGIKVDFFGGDGQSMIAYYLDILADAHRFGLMVNFHGSTFPRGWQRTYPNLMNMEGVKGFEYITFEQGNADAAPAHCCVLPFTRNLYDTMDFTPMNFSGIPGIERRTTVAFELATAVIFIAGIQHFAEIPAGMAGVPAEVKRFLQDLPPAWEEMKFIDGYPGEWVTLARRGGGKWYLAGLNGGKSEKKVTFKPPFLKARKSGLFFGDGEAPGSFDIKTVPCSPAGHTTITLKPYGGFVLVL